MGKNKDWKKWSHKKKSKNSDFLGMLIKKIKKYLNIIISSNKLLVTEQ